MAGAINIRLGAIVTDFVAGIQSARLATTRLTTELNNNLSASFAAADRQQRIFDRGIGRLGDNLQSFGRTASIVSAGIALVGASAFKTYADINALQLGLENITGSAAGATARFNELLPVVRLPGLGLEEAIKGDVRLQAVGFSALQSKNALLQFGNALALTGGGKFELDSILTQLTQMGSKAKVLAEDLKPILTSSPAVAKAIKELFGTVDSEQISAKLQSAGRGPQDFINDLVLKLSELERVKGGPKNAIENFTDSLKLAQFQFGKAADGALGLTSKLDGLGTFLGKAAEGFGSLSSGTQGAILTISGLALAIGPATLALGGAINLVRGLTLETGALTVGLRGLGAAFAFATGPIGLISLAVIGAATLIISNWSAIKKVLTDSGIWQTVSSLVTGAIATVKNVIQSGVTLAKSLWASFGGDIVRLGQSAFGAVSALVTNVFSNIGTVIQSGVTLFRSSWAVFGEGITNIAQGAFTAISGIVSGAFSVIGTIFKTVTGTLTGVFKVFTGVLSGDWKTFAEGLQNITASLWNGVIGLFSAGIGAAGSLLSGFLKSVGADGLAIAVESKIGSVTSSVEKLKIALKDTQSIAGNTLKTGIVTTTVRVSTKSDPTPKLKPFDYSSIDLGGSAFKKAKDRLKELKDEIASGKLKGIDTSALQAEYDQLSSRIKSATDSLKTQKKTVEGVSSSLTVNEQILKRVSRELKEQGENASPGLKAEVARLQEAVKAEKELLNLKPVDLGKLVPALPKGDFASAFSSLSNQATGKPLTVGLNVQVKSDSQESFFKGFMNRLGELSRLKPLDFLATEIEKIRQSINTVNIRDKFTIPQSSISSIAEYTKAIRQSQDNNALIDIAIDNKLGGNAPKLEAVQRIVESLRLGKNDVTLAVQEIADSLSANKLSLTNAAAGFLSGVGETIGKGGNPLKSALNLILNFLGDYAIRIGTAALISSKALLLAAPFLAGLTLPQGVGLQLTGAGLILAGGVVKGLAATAFASGALVYGPTLGLVGEGIGTTRRNPEVIAPLDSLQTILNKSIMSTFSKVLTVNRQITESVSRGIQRIEVFGQFEAQGSALSAVLSQTSLEEYYTK